MKRSGFTLIEILMATLILAFGLMALMAGLSNCAVMMTLSKEYQDAQYVFCLGELKYPIQESDDVEEDLPVEADSDLVEGYVFERTVDEKEKETNVEDDGLYVVRTRVSWGPGDDQSEELVRYVRQVESKSDKK
jgi:prepilin-type N-terminal cleavage/methylation domain-containing protein